MNVGRRDLLPAVAAYGLSGSLTRLPEGPLDPGAWSDLRAAAIREGLQGQLAWAVANGALRTTDAQRREAVELHTAAMVTCLRLERLLLEVLATLRSADVPVRVLAGPALAHTTYGDPTLRTFRDVDLLVRPPDGDAVLSALRDLGLRSPVPDRRPGDPSRIALLRRTDGLTVDLHATIAPPRCASELEVDVLFRNGSSYRLAGEQVPTLPPEQQLVHACFAARSAPDRRWASLRDIAQLVLNTDVEREAVAELARRWSAVPVVARAIHLTWQEFELADRVPLSEWAAREDGARSREGRRLLDGVLSADGPHHRPRLWDPLRRLRSTT